MAAMQAAARPGPSPGSTSTPVTGVKTSGSLPRAPPGRGGRAPSPRDTPARIPPGRSGARKAGRCSVPGSVVRHPRSRQNPPRRPKPAWSRRALAGAGRRRARSRAAGGRHGGAHRLQRRHQWSTLVAVGVAEPGHGQDERRALRGRCAGPGWGTPGRARWAAPPRVRRRAGSASSSSPRVKSLTRKWSPRPAARGARPG